MNFFPINGGPLNGQAGRVWLLPRAAGSVVLDGSTALSTRFRSVAIDGASPLSIPARSAILAGTTATSRPARSAILP